MTRATVLQNDCFAFDGPMAPFAEALDNLLSRVRPVVATEQVALIEATGRILAEPVTARKYSPPHNNAAVDGFAVRHSDLGSDGLTVLPVTVRVAAGHPASAPVSPGEAAQIFTGAVVPEGLDTIFMLEDCGFDGKKLELKPGIRRGANLRRRGEDIEAGAVILQPGIRLRPQDIALAAAAGVATLPVCHRLKVAVFSTGDEVYDPAVTADPPAGGIFDANRYALAGLLSDLGCELIDLGILPDRFDDIRAALAGAADQADAVITSGGVSLGEEDHVKAAVHDLGSLNHWRVAIKPGRPIAFGQIGTTPFVGLPGNPVAVMVTFWMFARPLLLKLAGVSDISARRYQVRSGFERSFKGPRREWLRAWLEPDTAGGWRAVCYPREGSGIINSLVAAEGLVEIPEEMTDISIGDMIDFLPFSEVRR
ncbi:MAG: molybdopterin molybdotransferase MoeA [Rhodospirillales bacterium]